jgi:hypothetical protein
MGYEKDTSIEMPKGIVYVIESSKSPELARATLAQLFLAKKLLPTPAPSRRTTT